jgi:hypothetical protein
MSYAYGNYFWIVNDSEAPAIRWGASNASEMAGVTVNVFLFQWTDTNGDEVSSSNERRYVGIGSHTFTGTEGDPAMIETILENFDNPGEPVRVDLAISRSSNTRELIQIYLSFWRPAKLVITTL